MRDRDKNPPHALSTGEPFPLSPLSSAESEASWGRGPHAPQVPAVEESQLQDTLHLALCRRGSQSPPSPKYIWDQSHLSVGVGCGRVVPLVPSPPLSSQKVSFPLSTSGILALGNQARVSHGPV